MIQYLVPYNATHLKALLARDRVHDHIPVDPDEVLAIEDRVLVLARGIYDLDREVVVLVANDFAEGVLDGGVVGVDEVTVYELDGEGALACLLLSRLFLKYERYWECVVPTDLLPTMAILRCFC